MTEAEWLEGTDLYGLIGLIGQTASRRKLLLYGCACCRRIEQYMVDDRSRKAVRLVEDFSDSADGDMLAAATAEAEAAFDAIHHEALAEVPNGASLSSAAFLDAMTPNLAQSYRAAHTVTQFGVDDPHAAAWYVAYFSAFLFGKDGWPAQEGLLIHLLRHIIGNPICPFPTPDHWPATVVQLADALYHGQDCGFALHDALLDAGQSDLADHFRQEQAHPKGCCWERSSRP